MADTEYIYDIIDNEEDARVCAQLIAEEFSEHNPITRFDHVTPAQFFEDCSWRLMKEMYPEHLSLFVRYRATNEIVGATIIGDLYRQQENSNFDQNENLKFEIPVGDLLVEMDHLFVSRDFGQELKPNMVIHVEICAVRSQHSGKGIAKKLCQEICDYANKERGYQYLLVQTTNPATRHMYVNRMNGKEVTIIDPTTWLWKNRGDGPMYPYKDYKGGLIPNILVKL